jgi:hypothetical protein
MNISFAEDGVKRTAYLHGFCSAPVSLLGPKSPAQCMMLCREKHLIKTSAATVSVPVVTYITGV